MVYFYAALAACWLFCAILNTITYTRNDQGVFLFLVFLDVFLFVAYLIMAIMKATE